jgi:hypothetical protein
MHSLKTTRLPLITAGFAAVALAGGGCDAPSDRSRTAAQTIASGEEADDQFCAVLIDKPGPGETTSRILGRECADSEEELDRSGLLIGFTKLMTLYPNADFSGKGDRLDGRSGPCDGEGYGVADVGSLWRNKISSFKGWNQCNFIQGFTNTDYGGNSRSWVDRAHADDSPALKVHYVGAPFNDKFQSFLLHREK